MKHRDNRFMEDFLKTIVKTPYYIRSPFYKNISALTSRYLLHEDLYEAVLAEGSEVLDNVLVL